MAWVRTDDTAPDHPKFLALEDDLAIALWWRALCWCNNRRTAGFVASGALHKLSLAPRPAALATKLVRVGLWEAVDGGFQVHDYDHYQGTQEEVASARAAEPAATAALSAAKREAGRLGGQRSAEARRASRSKQTGKQEQADRQAEPSSRASTDKAAGKQEPSTGQAGAQHGPSSRASDLGSDPLPGSPSGSEISFRSPLAAAPSGTTARREGSGEGGSNQDRPDEIPEAAPTPRSAGVPFVPSRPARPRPPPLPSTPEVDHEPERPGAKLLPDAGINVMAPFDPPPRIVDPEQAIRDVLARIPRPIGYLADTRTPSQLYAGMMASGRSIDDVADGIAGAATKLPAELQNASPEDPALMARLHAFVAVCVTGQRLRPRADKRAERGEQGAQAVWVLGTFGAAWAKAKDEPYVQGANDGAHAVEVVDFLRTQIAEAELQGPKRWKGMKPSQIAKAWLEHKIGGYLSDTHFGPANHPFAMLAAILKDKPARWGSPAMGRPNNPYEGYDDDTVRASLAPLEARPKFTLEDVARITGEGQPAVLEVPEITAPRRSYAENLALLEAAGLVDEAGESLPDEHGAPVEAGAVAI